VHNVVELASQDDECDLGEACLDPAPPPGATV